MASSSSFVLDPAIFNRELYTSVLRFWLPVTESPSSDFSQDDVQRWFVPSVTTDDNVRAIAASAVFAIGPDQFQLPPFTSLEDDALLYEEIAAPFETHLCSWPEMTKPSEATASSEISRAALALSIILDQFPRNLFRGPKQTIIFTHYDRIARAVAALIDSYGLNRTSYFEAAPVFRYWFYLPLEHSELFVDHERFRAALDSMLQIVRDAEDEKGVRFVSRALEIEQRHLEPLKVFGRFPWRNQWLGRVSTEAEVSWLENGGDRFGTS